MATVTVAVVSWNTRELLRACLASLAADAESGVAEVWVVDNASDDGSPDMVRDEFGWARLVASEENLGFGPAVNLVAERAGGEWIAPANADVALEPGTLQRLVAAAEADARTGAVAPRLVTPDGATQHSVHSFPTVTLSLMFGLGLTRVVPGLGDRLAIEGRWDPERSRAVDWAHAAFLLVRRRAFDEIGGFDPRQWLYAEDLDLAWRLRRAGWDFRYEPAAVVRHAVSAATSKAFGDERLGRYMEATYGWMARRRGLAVTWTFAAANLAISVSRYLALVPLARLAPRRFAARRDLMRAYVGVHRRGLRNRAALTGFA